MSLHDITVRASSLSQYVDCPRRWAARHIGGLVVAAGFYPRSLPSSIGAAIGSGTHAAVGFDLLHKMEHGELPAFRDAEAAGVAELEERIEREGVLWDEVSQDLSDAQLQVRRLAKTYREDVSHSLTPAAVERRLNVRHSTGMVVSGQTDIFLEAPNRLRDIKTGKRRGANFAQYGTYTRLLRSHGKPVGSIIEDFLPRVPLKKEQPRVIPTPYDIDTCETQTEQTLKRVARDVQTFRDTGDRESFAANPSSGLCSDRYCPAWGTAFCTLGRKF